MLWLRQPYPHSTSALTRPVSWTREAPISNPNSNSNALGVCRLSPWSFVLQLYVCAVISSRMMTGHLQLLYVRTLLHWARRRLQRRLIQPFEVLRHGQVKVRSWLRFLDLSLHGLSCGFGIILSVPLHLSSSAAFSLSFFGVLIALVCVMSSGSIIVS